MAIVLRILARCRPLVLGAFALVLLPSCTGEGGAPGESPALPPEPGREIMAAEQPDSTRDAVAHALRLAAAAASEDEAAVHIATARSHAVAYAEAWDDPFLIRRVARFETASPADRRSMAAADSLWREGREIIGREGVPVALGLWRESLRLATAASDSAGVATALYVIGAGHYMASDLDSATIYLDRAYALAAEVGDHRTVGNAMGTLASVALGRGDLLRAAQLYEEAAPIRARSGDGRGQAADANNLGLVARALGDLDGARAAFDNALRLNLAAGRDRAAAVNLTNLGDIASIRGEYAAADSAYRAALELNRAAGDMAETGFALHRLGMLAARRGDLPGASAWLREALDTHAAAGARMEVIAVRTDLAAIEAAMGDFEAALANIRRAQADAEAGVASPAVRGRLALVEADLALEFGTPAVAEDRYTAAERLFEEAGDQAGRAEALHGHALLLHLRDDPDAALRLLDLSRAPPGTADPRASASAQILAGTVHAERGDTAAARTALTAALDAFASIGDPVGMAAAEAALGELALRRGTALAAESLFRNGLERLGELQVPDTRWRLHAGLAAALRASGRPDLARAELEAAVATIESAVATIPGEDRRSAFLAEKWQVYGAAALAQQAAGRLADAFETSERMRARQMLAILEHGRVSTPAATGAREQDLRRQIAELTRELEATISDGAALREPGLSDSAIDVARETLAAAQAEYAALLADIRERQPEYARMVAADFVGWREVAERLDSDEALLQYLLTDSAALVFVVRRDTIASLELGVGRQTLANLVDFARHALGRPTAPEDGEAGSLWEGALRRLDHYLMQPVRASGMLDGVRRLVVVPHGELNFLPFAALIADEPAGTFLVERFELSYAPSASVWVRLAGRARRSPGRVLALAPYPDRLPGSEEEVNGIRAALGRQNTTLLLGDAASETALRTQAPRHGTIHLATFGVLNKHNPLFSYVELAPPTGGDRGDPAADGRLEVHRIFDLALDGQLVVLSACQTALGSGALADVPAGDDWVGLMQAFLQAGAGSVLASQWTVDDRATSDLMQRFYRALAAGESEAAALAAAQRAMARQPATAHPFFWAGFALTGARSE